MAKKKAQAKAPAIDENGNMLVYSYHPSTGAYVGSDVAFPDPLEQGKYLIPAHATNVPPPEHEDGKVRTWNGSEWVLEDEPIEQPVQAPEKTDEQKAAEARDIRNSLLFQSDWTQLPDIPAWVNKAAWATYRQALRDVPQQEDFPTSINWPTAP